jgi:hypothetical protein
MNDEIERVTTTIGERIVRNETGMKRQNRMISRIEVGLLSEQKHAYEMSKSRSVISSYWAILHELQAAINESKFISITEPLNEATPVPISAAMII